MEVWWFAGDESEMIASVGILRWQDDGTGYVGFMVFPYDIKGKCERMSAEKALADKQPANTAKIYQEADTILKKDAKNIPLDSTPSCRGERRTSRTQSGHKQTTNSQS